MAIVDPISYILIALIFGAVIAVVAVTIATSDKEWPL